MSNRYIALFVIPILVGCKNQSKESVLYDVVVPEVTTHNYFEVQDKFVAWDNVFEIDESLYFLYYFSPTCSHCGELKDWIIGKALRYDNIYFVQSSEKDVFIKDPQNTIGATSAGEIGILGHPSMVEIESKKVVQNVAGKTKIKELLISNNYIE